jgi:hypothetical protein
LLKSFVKKLGRRPVNTLRDSVIPLATSTAIPRSKDRESVTACRRRGHKLAFSGTVAVFLDLDEVEGDLADLGFPQLGGRASEEGGELAVVGEIVTCGGGAEIAEDEVLGRAVVKLSQEALLVKEKRVH